MGEWREQPLSSLCVYLNRGAAPAYTDACGILVVNQKCIRDQRVDFTLARRTDPQRKPVAAKRIIQPFDILVNSTGVGTLGRVAQVRTLPEMATVDSHITLVRPDSRAIDPLYLGLAIRCFESEIEALGEGSTGQTELSRARLGTFLIPIPTSLEEQRAIAHILGTLDDKIECNRRRNQTLEAMARALFQDWFIDFGPVRAKLEGQEPYLPADLWQLFPDRLDAEGKPEGWEMQPLSELFVIIGGGTPKTSVAEYWGGDIPWFSVVDTPEASDVFVISTEKSITEQGLAGSSARLIPKGTTIISARGTVGNLAIAGRDMTFNQSCYGLRGTKGVGDYFVYLTAQKMVDQLKSMAHGSVFSTITRQTFEAIQRPVPPPAVLEAFERLVTEWFDTILSSVEESRTLAQLRDTLLPKLISGELRIADAERFIEERAL